MVVCGESGDVRGETVDSWKESLPELVQMYQQVDIWNVDENGCFWKGLPDKGLGQCSCQCRGGKKANKGSL